jgi:hypothetical protein
MDTWEYLSVQVLWKSKEEQWEGWWEGKVMKAAYPHDVLKPFGLGGWELVAFTPDNYCSSASVLEEALLPDASARPTTKWVVSSYQAMFKRRLPAVLSQVEPSHKEAQ